MKNFIKGVEMLERGLTMFAGGPVKFYFKEFTESYEYMMQRFCPFRIGDRVALSKTPVIDQLRAPGWIDSRHFLIVGAEGTITEAYCRGDGFRFGVIFDKETYIHPHTGEETPVSSKHVYTFKEDELRLVK